jgi:hypothetical protein
MITRCTWAGLLALVLVAGCAERRNGGAAQNQNGSANANAAGNNNGNANENGNANANANDNGSVPILDTEYYSTDRPRLNGVAYYVAPNGDDADPGTLDSPWATVQHAADVIQPGNVVYLRAGVYAESVATVRSGTASGDIVFAAYAGEHPILDGTGVDANNGFIVAHDYIVLDGLTLRNWNENGIWMEQAAFPYLVDCEVYNGAYGIGASNGTHDFVFDHVVAHDYDLYGFDASPGNADCYNGIFWQCLAHTGRDPEQNVDGFALGHGTQHDFTFYRCHTYGVYDGFDISSRDTRLERCSAHDCGNAGFKIWQDAVELVNCLGYESENANLELDWDSQPGTVTVRNCTLVGSDTFNIWIENAGDALHLYNTIMAGGRGIGLATEQADVSLYQGDYNLFQNETARAFVIGYEDEFSTQQLASWQAATGQDAHSLTASTLTELFVYPTVFDYHLATNSPAVDQGSSAGAPTNDYDGTARPQGSGVDIGAFER